MKRWVVALVIIAVMLGCDNRSTSPENEHSAKLEVYFNDELFYDETLTESDDSTSVTVILPDDSECQLDKYYFETQTIPQADIFYSYRVIAKKFGYYSTYHSCGQQDTITVNASGGFPPVSPGLVCGSIIHLYYDPFVQEEFYILQDSLIVDSLTTTANGYFSIDIPFEEYQIAFKCMYPGGVLYDFIVDSVYIDCFIDSYIFVDKPNIYIYPEEDITIDVTIDFPLGGSIIESIPAYNEVWKDLQVEPSGLINGKHNYLFYESANPDLSQYNEGWIIAQDDLESFFTLNLAETGFEGQEIIDFTEFWIPILTDYPFYAIYPQYNEQISKMIELEFSIEPDNLLRLIYAIKGLQDDDIVLHEPEIPEFIREGFVVVEWGVIRKSDNTICQK